MIKERGTITENDDAAYRLSESITATVADNDNTISFSPPKNNDFNEQIIDIGILADNNLYSPVTNGAIDITPKSDFAINTKEKTNTNKYPVLTLEKALEIINYFKTHENDDGISLTEISTNLDMKKSSVHRILNTLLEYNYIEKIPGGKKFRLSWELYYIGNTIPQRRNLSPSLCLPIIKRLCNKYNESINMSILSGDEAVVIYCAEPAIGVKISNAIGDRQPLYATAKGKLFLSQMSENEIFNYYNKHEIERYTPYTIVTPGKMLNEIADITSVGYAMDREEHFLGITCVSFPVRNYDNRIIATLSCSGITQSITSMMSDVSELKQDLIDACNELSLHMGYHG